MATLVSSFTPASSQATGVQSLTCITCRLMFPTTKDQRNHYQSELHRFNLKRKVAELPPVSQEAYLQKIQNQKEKEGATSSKERGGRNEKTPSTIASYNCELCNKQYASPNAYSQHIKSNKHKERAANPEAFKQSKAPKENKAEVTPSSTQESATNEEIKESPVATTSDSNSTEVDEEKMIEERIKNARRLALEECLFCLAKSEDLQSNLDHMTKDHSFFIPDIEYLQDLEGLVKYLGEKVSVGLTCLFCNGKGKSFWTLEGVQTHMKDMAHCKLDYDENEAEYEDFYDFTVDYQKSSDGTIIPYDQSQGFTLSENGSEIVFANGKTIGHRSMAIYYKQRYRREEKHNVIINSLISQYKALGWTSTPKKPAAQYLPKGELRKQAWAQTKMGIKNNNQKHHRDEHRII